MQYYKIIEKNNGEYLFIKYNSQMDFDTYKEAWQEVYQKISETGITKVMIDARNMTEIPYEGREWLIHEMIPKLNALTDGHKIRIARVDSFNPYNHMALKYINDAEESQDFLKIEEFKNVKKALAYLKEEL